MPKTAVSSDLIAAYRRTRYGVLSDPPFDFTVGQVSVDLKRCMAQHHSLESVYLTACNPFSQVLTSGENELRQTALAQTLRSTGHAFVVGMGQDPDAVWPAESSFLVFGMPLEEGKALGRLWEQNAIVWSGADAVPQLVLLR